MPRCSKLPSQLPHANADFVGVKISPKSAENSAQSIRSGSELLALLVGDATGFSATFAHLVFVSVLLACFFAVLTLDRPLHTLPPHRRAICGVRCDARGKSLPPQLPPQPRDRRTLRLRLQSKRRVYPSKSPPASCHEFAIRRAVRTGSVYPSTNPDASSPGARALGYIDAPGAS